ncbi:MAG: hypothetical protein M3Y34_04575 [Actinomycetota bacterium]|nr:hypothetical protein [Actinomycetota bacterium]
MRIVDLNEQAAAMTVSPSIRHASSHNLSQNASQKGVPPDSLLVPLTAFRSWSGPALLNRYQRDGAGDTRGGDSLSETRMSQLPGHERRVADERIELCFGEHDRQFRTLATAEHRAEEAEEKAWRRMILTFFARFQLAEAS